MLEVESAKQYGGVGLRARTKVDLPRLLPGIELARQGVQIFGKPQVTTRSEQPVDLIAVPRHRNVQRTGIPSAATSRRRPDAQACRQVGRGWGKNVGKQRPVGKPLDPLDDTGKELGIEALGRVWMHDKMNSESTWLPAKQPSIMSRLIVQTALHNCSWLYQGTRTLACDARRCLKVPAEDCYAASTSRRIA